MINFSSEDCADNTNFLYLCNLRYLRMKNQEFVF